MISEREFNEQYIRAAEAAMRLRVDAQAVARLIQRGALDGVMREARWYASAESVERLRAAKEDAALAALSSVGAVA